MLKLIAYTDGSCMPVNNTGRGYIGWGAHCVMGTIGTDSKMFKVPGGYSFTENGYLQGNLKSSLIVTEVLDLVGSYPKHNTNNVAELMAIVNVLQVATYKKVVDVLIHTDSTYALGCLEKIILGSIKPPFNNVNANKDIMELMYKAYKDTNAYGHTKVSIVHVKAHMTDPGNITADKLAMVGRLKSERPDVGEDFNDLPSETFTSGDFSTEYWSMTWNKYNSFNSNRPIELFVSNLYDISGFYSIPTKGFKKAYGFLSYSEPFEIGKPSEGILSGILYTNYENNILSLTAKKLQAGLDVSRATSISIATLFKNNVNRMLRMFGVRALIPSKNSGRYYSLKVLPQPEDLEVYTAGMEIYPAPLISNVEDMFKDLTYTLGDIDGGLMESIDLFEEWFDVEVNKKGKRIVKVKRKNNDNYIKLNHIVGKKNVKVTLAIGIDLPDFNSVNRMRNDIKEFKCYIRKVSYQCIETYVLITTDTLRLITCDQFGNKIYFKG